jgi:hypothetical protein
MITTLRHATVAVVSSVITLLAVVPWVSTAAHAAQPHSTALSLSQASQAFDTTWPGFDSGFDHGDIAQVKQFATGEMAQVIEGSTDCGCGPWIWQKSSVKFSVPVENHYPYSFLAEVSNYEPGNNSFVEDVVLTKPDALARWRVAYMVDYSGSISILEPSAIRPVPPAPVPIAGIGDQVALFFETMVNTGGPPPNNVWTLDGSLAQEVKNNAGVKQEIEQGGDAEVMTMKAVDHSIAFASTQGDIMCGAYRATASVSTPPNTPTVQPNDRSNWDPLLPPGSYSSVTEHGIHDYCVTDTVSAVVTPISFFGGVYAKTGVKGS